MKPPPTYIPQRKKRLWRRPIGVVLLILVALLVSGCSTVFYVIACTPSSPLDINRSRGTTTSIDAGSDESYSINGDREWFDTYEEAIAAREISHERVFMSDQIDIVENEVRADALYFATFVDGDRQYSEFIVYRFERQNEKVTTQVGVSYYALVDLNNRVDGSYYYDSEEIKVAEYIDQSMKDPSSSPTGLPFAYFGVSENRNISEMTVLGMYPDDVIEYTYEGITYYFWYYDNLPIQEYLTKSSDFSFGGYTLRQLIEVLDIKTPESE